MTNLRTDPKQWLIHEEAPVTAGVQGIEVLALTISGNLLAVNENVELRAVGNLMLHWADARQRSLDDRELGSDAVEFITQVLDWMGGQGERPDEALDQLHAIAFQFDSTLAAAGINGDGWYRTLARGEHGR
jgi:hypothetical protein